MATGGERRDSLIQVSVNYQGTRTVLHLAQNTKISQAIQKAAEKFEVSPDGLTFLYKGQEITDDMLVGTALAKAGNVTVIHLISVKDKGDSTVRFNVPDIDKPKQNIYAYCKTCLALAPARESLTCPYCHKDQFQRHSATPLDHFAPEIAADILKGECAACKKMGQAVVEFECCSCKSPDKVCPLRQIRDNPHKLSCMKCGLKKDMIFRLACSSRHTMCTDCFSSYCQVMLSASKFKMFDSMGFSVCCPGNGADCPYTPVPDPHHFKLINEDSSEFYDNFIGKAGEAIVPSGNNIICTKCSIEIDVTEGKEEPVTEPITPTVQGLKWYHKYLFMKKPAPPPPRMRKRTSCRQCGLGYCIGCKQVWHDGDCLPLDSALREEESMFPIDPAHAKDSCWPQNEH